MCLARRRPPRAQRRRRLVAVAAASALRAECLAQTTHTQNNGPKQTHNNDHNNDQKKDCNPGFGRFIYAGNVERGRGNADQVWPLCVRCPANYVAPGGSTSIYCMACPSSKRPSPDRSRCSAFFVVVLLLFFRLLFAKHTHTNQNHPTNTKKTKKQSSRARPTRSRSRQRRRRARL